MSWTATLGLRKRGALLGNYALAAVDQSIVSAISFLTLIVLAHWTNATELGIYVLASSALGVLSSIQHALIATPYSIQRHRVAVPESEQAFAGLAQCAGLAACSAGLLGILGLAFGYFEYFQLSGALLALAAAAPFVLMREFVREFSFAHFQIRRAFTLDLASVSIQLAAICILVYTSRLSALTAVALIGILSAIPAVISLVLNRGDFSRPKNIGSLIANHFRLGRWLLISRSGVLFQGYAGIWISGLIAGITTTAIYSACVSVVAFANPLLFGLYNVLSPRAAVALKEQGPAGLWKNAIRDAVLLGTIMAAFVLAITLSGEQLLSLLYPGEYRGHGGLIVILACAALVSAIGIPPSNGLSSLECGREVAALSIASSVFTLSLVALLLAHYGLVGAGVAALIGSLATTSARWIIFRRRLPEMGKSGQTGAGQR